MKFRQTVPDSERKQLLKLAMRKIEVILKGDKPSCNHCNAIINEYLAEISKEPEVWLSEATVFELGLTEKAANVLYREGYKTVRSLIGATADELLQVPNFGVAGVARLRNALRSRNLSLRNDEEGKRLGA